MFLAKVSTFTLPLQISPKTDTISALFKKVLEKVCKSPPKQTLFQHRHPEKTEISSAFSSVYYRRHGAPGQPVPPPTKKGSRPPQGQLLAKNFRDVSLDQISSTRTLVRWIVAVSPCLPMLNSRRPLLSSFSFISNSKTKVCHSVVRSIEVSGK